MTLSLARSSLRRRQHFVIDSFSRRTFLSVVCVEIFRLGLKAMDHDAILILLFQPYNTLDIQSAAVSRINTNFRLESSQSVWYDKIDITYTNYINYDIMCWIGHQG